MKTKPLDNAKLGMFVMAGVAFLVLTLYMIGKNRNLLGSTFPVRVKMENVNGLLPGNNVRFRGIDVGTVKEIQIADDTSIYVTLTIHNKFKRYIKQNAIAAIGTDGLMGNKLVNINSQPGAAEPVEEGSVIRSLHPIETEEMLRTLNTTNNNIAAITRNLEQITGKLNQNNSLWSILGDTLIAEDIKKAIHDIRQAGRNTSMLTAEAQEVITDLRKGEGFAGVLLTDTVWKTQLSNSFNLIEAGSKDISKALQNLNLVIENINNGEGTAGRIIADTVWSHKLFHALSNVEEGSVRFNENMEALKHNFLFRKYFRKQEKLNRQKDKPENL